MIATPLDIQRDKSQHEKWDQSLRVLTLEELRSLARTVNATESSTYSLYVSHVNEELWLRERIWVTSKGESIKLENMTTEHLENSSTKIIREGWRKPWLCLIQNELFHRSTLVAQNYRFLQEVEDETMNGLFEPRS